MEAVFASIILIGLITFGISLSLNNHRQAIALAQLRGKMEAWAEQDLRIKRERSARDVKVEDPRRWLEDTAARALGRVVQIVRVDFNGSDEIPILKADTTQQMKLFFTPIKRSQLLKESSGSDSRLGRLDEGPLGKHPNRLECCELSILNCGLFFDLEASQVWKMLTGNNINIDRLWVYVRAPGK